MAGANPISAVLLILITILSKRLLSKFIQMLFLPWSDRMRGNKLLTRDSSPHRRVHDRRLRRRFVRQHLPYHSGVCFSYLLSILSSSRLSLVLRKELILLPVRYNPWKSFSDLTFALHVDTSPATSTPSISSTSTSSVVTRDVWDRSRRSAHRVFTVRIYRGAG